MILDCKFVSQRDLRPEHDEGWVPHVDHIAECWRPATAEELIIALVATHPRKGQVILAKDGGDVFTIEDALMYIAGATDEVKQRVEGE